MLMPDRQTTIRQAPNEDLVFEVFIDYDPAEYVRLVDYLTEHHNVQSGIQENIDRCHRAVDELHRNRLVRSEVYQSAKLLDPMVRIAVTKERDVFSLLFREANAAMIFKLTHC